MLAAGVEYLQAAIHSRWGGLLGRSRRPKELEGDPEAAPDAVFQHALVTMQERS